VSLCLVQRAGGDVSNNSTRLVKRRNEGGEGDDELLRKTVLVEEARLVFESSESLSSLNSRLLAICRLIVVIVGVTCTGRVLPVTAAVVVLRVDVGPDRSWITGDA
jgi:hypothetical protein